jgi:hypothetical protein
MDNEYKKRSAWKPETGLWRELNMGEISNFSDHEGNGR